MLSYPLPGDGRRDEVGLGSAVTLMLTGQGGQSNIQNEIGKGPNTKGPREGFDAETAVLESRERGEIAALADLGRSEREADITNAGRQEGVGWSSLP